MNRAPFTTFQEFLEERDLDPHTYAPVTCSAVKATRWAALGEQRRTFFNGQKSAPQQLISLKLSPTEHFTQAARLAQQESFPMDDGDAGADLDLVCAARMMVMRKGDLHTAREEWYSAVKELAKRMEACSERLRGYQPPTIRAVAGKVSVAFLAMAAILMLWPHTSLPRNFVSGVKVIGAVEETGVYRPTELWTPQISEEQLLAGASDAIDEIERSRPKQEDAEFIRAACEKDRLAGNAGGYFTRQDFGGQGKRGDPYSGVQRCAFLI